MKKIFIFLISSVLLFSACVSPCFASLYEPAEFDAGVCYMISLDDDTVVCDINSDEKISPASITKIVTAILTIENCTDFEQIVTVPSYAIRLLDGTNSSTAGILVGEEMSVKDLLYCLLIQSANDAANVLADFIGGGSIETFVGMMNDFVKSLGCLNTHFVNSHGLDDPDHYSTAKDLATIYRYCLQNGMFSEITGTYAYDMPATNLYHYTRYLRNTNGLLNPGISDYYYEYAKNGKTGTTDNAGRCLISSASKDGYNYLCVIINGEFYDCDGDNVEENMAIIESKKLYQWAFENLRIREVANPTTYVPMEVEVRLSKDYDYVSLAPANSISALVPSGVNAKNVLIEPMYEITKTTVDAPVRQGDVLGRATVKYADEAIAEVDLVAAFDVNRSTIKYIGDKISKIFHSPVFIILFIVILALVIPACIMIFVVAPQKRRTKKNTIRVVKPADYSNNKKK